jgi:hypothetical protein
MTAPPVARCDAGFLLFRLPYAPSCSLGYCTATDMGERRATGCDVPGHAPGSGSPCGEHATCIADGTGHSCAQKVRICAAVDHRGLI